MLLDFLTKTFEEGREQEAFIWQDQSYNYAWLLEQRAGWATKLRQLSVDAGSVVILNDDFSPDAIALFLALIDHGCISVPLTFVADAEKNQLIQLAQGQWTARKEENGSFNLTDLNCQAPHPLYEQLRKTQNPGLVLFSSGTTGRSKAAVHDLSRLLEKFRQPRHNLRTLAFLHFDHIGGIDTLFYCLSNASCLIFLSDRSPEIVCRAIEKHRIQVLPVAPTFLNFLSLSKAYQHYDLSSLKYVTYGAEVMPEVTLKRCQEMFPGVTILQKYGTTEIGTLHSKSKSSDSLWMKIGGQGYQTRIVDGCLQIKAESSMLGYLNAPSPFTEDGWFITGDAVEIDGEYLKILGRASDIINVGGEKVYPAEVESVLQDMSNVADVTVYGESHPLAGQIVCAKITLLQEESRQDLLRRVNQFCYDRLQPYKVPFKVEIVDGEHSTKRFKKKRQQDECQ